MAATGKSREVVYTSKNSGRVVLRVQVKVANAAEDGQGRGEESEGLIHDGATDRPGGVAESPATTAAKCGAVVVATFCRTQRGAASVGTFFEFCWGAVVSHGRSACVCLF